MTLMKPATTSPSSVWCLSMLAMLLRMVVSLMVIMNVVSSYMMLTTVVTATQRTQHHRGRTSLDLSRVGPSSVPSLTIRSRRASNRSALSRHRRRWGPSSHPRQTRGGGVASTPPSTELSSTSSPLLEYNASGVDAGAMSIESLLSVLKTDPDAGLSQVEATRRLAQYGRNELIQPPSKSLLALIAEQFEDRLVQILLVVAIMSAIFSVLDVQKEQAAAAAAAAAAVDAIAIEPQAIWKSFVEPLVILAILILNAVVGIWQTQSATDSLKALQDLQPALATCLRDAQWRFAGSGGGGGGGGGAAEVATAGGSESSDASIVDPSAPFSATDLVPGDIIQIRVGDKIPADARLLSIQSSQMQVDEGSLTGESVTVSKIPGNEGTNAEPNQPIQDARGMLFAGTMVTSGNGRAVVVQSGMDTEMGKIQQGVTDAKADEVKTPLALKLDEFGETLTLIIGVICFAVWCISIPKMNDPSFGSVWEGAIYYAKVAIALGVAAIPEGLPAVITLCLSLGTRSMARRNVIVRKLQSVETLGCTSVICTDKTGTLTTNEMTAVSLVLFEHGNKKKQKKLDAASRGDDTIVEHPIDGFSYSPIGHVQGIDASHKEIRDHPLGSVADTAAICALCNDARIVGNDANTIIDDAIEVDAVAVNNNSASEVTAQAVASSTVPLKTSDSATKKTYERVGEPTEAALCVLAEKLGGMEHYLERGKYERSDLDGVHIDIPPSIIASANVNYWRGLHPRVATLEFNRNRKSMSVLCQYPKGEYPSPQDYHGGVKSRAGGKNRLLVKGAPNLLIERCTHVKFRDGTVAKLSGALRRSIENTVAEMAARPLRCLALAVKDGTNLESSLQQFSPQDERDLAHHPLLSDASNYKNIETGLTLVSVIGIKDPARPEVADSIKECSSAGIRVLMITGDAKDTAIAIARDVNIFPPARHEEEGQSATGSPAAIKAFEGREFFNKPEKEQLEILREDNIVFCRAEPADKQKLVKMLQSLGEIPAMTGDGVNDAPALQQAAIGIAMGITGTEVSKEAADMILADDNFSTIVNAVEEGRRIYANMQAFICFLISCNIGEICAIFFSTLAGFPEPLTAMHLLWVNLVTDGPPATALGFNPPAPDLMEQSPRPSDEPIMTRWLLTRYVITGLYVGLATIGVFAQHYTDQGITIDQLTSWSKCGEFWSPPNGAGVAMCSDLFQGSGRMLPQTLALTTLVCMEMIKALAAVSVDNSIFRVGPQQNPWLLLGVAGPFLLHLLVIYSSKLDLPALGDSFGVVPLTTDHWVTVLAWALPILLVDEILKFVGRYLYREDRIKAAEERARAKQRKQSLPIK